MDTIVQIITAVLQTGVISFVIFMIIRGLKTEIKTLQTQIINQNKTIETMDKRIQETEKIGELYKNLVSDFPKALEDYQEVITKTKDKTIYELKSTLDEKNTLLSDLKDLSPKKMSRASAITKLLLAKDNKELSVFLEKLDKDKDKITEKLIIHESFDELIANLNYKLKIIDVQDITKVFGNSDFMKENNLRTSTFFIGGSGYMITFDNEVRMTHDIYTLFSTTYNSIN